MVRARQQISYLQENWRSDLKVIIITIEHNDRYYMKIIAINFAYSQDSGVFTASLHPGVVRTELLRNIGEGVNSLIPIFLALSRPIFLVFTKSSEEGAQTTIHCAVADGLEKYNGCYFRY